MSKCTISQLQREVRNLARDLEKKCNLPNIQLIRNDAPATGDGAVIAADNALPFNEVFGDESAFTISKFGPLDVHENVITPLNSGKYKIFFTGLFQLFPGPGPNPDLLTSRSRIIVLQKGEEEVSGTKTLIDGLYLAGQGESNIVRATFETIVDLTSGDKLTVVNTSPDGYDLRPVAEATGDELWLQYSLVINMLEKK